jgi:hypothetical protein
MDNKDKNKSIKLNDNNLEDVTGGVDSGVNSFQCPFCTHPPFDTNSELINHVNDKHKDKTIDPGNISHSGSIRWT